jgi:hypothetical protein
MHLDAQEVWLLSMTRSWSRTLLAAFTAHNKSAVDRTCFHRFGREFEIHRCFAGNAWNEVTIVTMLVALLWRYMPKRYAKTQALV